MALGAKQLVAIAVDTYFSFPLLGKIFRSSFCFHLGALSSLHCIEFTCVRFPCPYLTHPSGHVVVALHPG